MRQSKGSWLRRLGWWGYQAAQAGLLALAAPFLLARKGGHYGPTLAPRLGLRQASVAAPAGALWLHAVSVGEVGVAMTLIRSLPPELPLLVTTVTPTGQERARAALASRLEAGTAAVDYLPFDFGAPVDRFLERHRPAALVMVEGDYWPLLLDRARRRDLPVAVVNGRLSDRGFRRLHKRGAWLHDLRFGAVAHFGVQTEQDRERLLQLGVAADSVLVTGNLKYETPPPPSKPEVEAWLRRLAREGLTGERPLLIAGSTMSGEDEIVLDAFAQLGSGARALLVLVPRHPERWDEVAQLVERRGLQCRRRSQMAARGTGGEQGTAPPDVVLLDSLGELAALYRLARGAFIGGTLVDTGGHNPLEAACVRVPVVVGPSMHNFREIAGHFDEAEAWARVEDASSLAAVWDRWLQDAEAAAALGARGRSLIDANRGAVAATLGLLQPVLDTVLRRSVARKDVAEGQA